MDKSLRAEIEEILNGYVICDETMTLANANQLATALESLFNKKKYKYLRQKRVEKYPWFSTLVMIRQRCENPKTNRYKNYGGRGIKCLITAEELEKIWNRDNASSMKRPSIDRIDNDGDYTFANCRYIETSENTSKMRQRQIDKALLCNSPIAQLSYRGEFIKKWKNSMVAAKTLGLRKQDIDKCVRGKDRKHCHGFMFLAIKEVVEGK